MADKKIVGLDPLITPLGTDISEVSDSTGTLPSKKQTRAQELAYINANAQITEPQVTNLPADLASLQAQIDALAMGTPPIGPAGGDLSGTYPNPLIGDSKVTNVKIADNTIDLTAKVTNTLPENHGGTGNGTPLTMGSIVFESGTPAYTQDNSNFFWQNTNKTLLIGKNTQKSTSSKIETNGGVAGTVGVMQTISSPRTYAVSATDGFMIVGTPDNGTLGSHDYGTIMMGSNPATGDGGAALFELRVGGTSSNSSNNGLFLQAVAGAGNVVTGINLFTNANQRMSIDQSGNVNISGLTASQLVQTDASKNLTSLANGTTSQYLRGDITFQSLPDFIYNALESLDDSLTFTQDGEKINLEVNSSSTSASTFGYFNFSSLTSAPFAISFSDTSTYLGIFGFAPPPAATITNSDGMTVSTDAFGHYYLQNDGPASWFSVELCISGYYQNTGAPHEQQYVLNVALNAPATIISEQYGIPFTLYDDSNYQGSATFSVYMHTGDQLFPCARNGGPSNDPFVNSIRIQSVVFKAVATSALPTALPDIVTPGNVGGDNTAVNLTISSTGLITDYAAASITPSAIGAPGITGSGASGTWGINISGNAATATTAGGAPPTGAATGDLGLFYPNPSVLKINGVALGATTATSGNILIGSGTQWVTQAMSGDAALGNSGILTIQPNAVAYSKFQQVAANSLVGNATGSTANAGGITLGSTLAFSSSVLQTAALTGDITTSANSFATTLATVNSNVGSFGSATQTGTFTVNGKGQLTAAANVTISGVSPGGSASNDLSGTYPGPTVAKINGVTLGTTTATSGNLLIGSGTQWVTNPVTGDVTITSSGVTAIGSLKVTNSQIAAATIDLTAKVTGILPGANGGTGNGFTAFSGPASTLKTFTLPNASATILTDNSVVTAAQGGTGASSPTIHTLPVAQGSSAYNFVGPLTNGQILIGSTGADPVPATIAAGNGIALTNTAGGISIASQDSSNNLLFTGDFGVNPWQYGTTITSPIQNQYVADFWQWRVAGAGTVTVTQDTDVPTVASLGHYSSNSLGVQVTATNTPASGEYNTLETIIEGYDFQQIAQQPFVISFWVKSLLTGICSVALRNSGANRYYVAEFTIASSGVWQYVSLPIPASPSAGTWNYTNGIGLDVLFPLNAGSSLQGAAGSWTTGSVVASNNQINQMSSTSNYLKLNSVKIERGVVPTLFVPLSAQTMLTQCQRRYEKTYNQGVVAATNTSVGAFQYSNTGTVAGSFVNAFQFQVPKRTTAAVTVYSVAGTSGSVTQTDATEIAVATSSVGMNSFLMAATNGALKNGCEGHMISSANF